MTYLPGDLRKDQLYTRDELLAGGMHRRELDSEAMVRVFPGWWMRADVTPDFWSLAILFQESVRPGAVISHQTAAELHGFPLPRALTRAGGAPLHCRGPAGRARVNGRLVVAHRTSERPTVLEHGLRLSHPLTALQEIAPELDRVDLIVCLDALAADRNGTFRRMRVPEISAFLESHGGRGASALRRVLPEVRERSWSPMETRFRLMLVEHGYPVPELNVPIEDPETGKTYFADLAYRDRSIAIEYDSDDHRRDKKRWRGDIHKNEVLHRLGWILHRVSIDDYVSPEGFFSRLDLSLRNSHPSSA